MSDTETLCCDNHPLKYHGYCKYHDTHLVGYNTAIKPKLKAYCVSL